MNKLKESEYYSGVTIDEDGFAHLEVSFDCLHNVLGKFLGRLK